MRTITQIINEHKKEIVEMVRLNPELALSVFDVLAIELEEFHFNEIKKEMTTSYINGLNEAKSLNEVKF